MTPPDQASERWKGPVGTSVFLAALIGGILASVLAEALFFWLPSGGEAGPGILIVGVALAQLPAVVFRMITDKICDANNKRMPVSSARRWTLVSFLGGGLLCGGFMLILIVCIT